MKKTSGKKKLSGWKTKCSLFSKDQSGFILGLVMVFFVVFTIMGLGFMEMSFHERVRSLTNYDKMRAFYAAQAGIHRGIWLAWKVSKAEATYSEPTVSVVYDSVNQVITATGLAGSVSDSIRVSLNGNYF